MSKEDLPVGVWLREDMDNEILIMLFEGTIKDFKCPKCNKVQEVGIDEPTVTCKCGCKMYSPIYDPNLDF